MNYCLLVNEILSKDNAITLNRGTIDCWKTYSTIVVEIKWVFYYFRGVAVF